MDETQVIDSWFKTVTGQGIGLAFTAVFLLLILIGIAALIRIGIIWLPILLKSFVDTQAALVRNNNLLVDMAEHDRRDVSTLITVGGHLVECFHLLTSKHGERLGIGSDVIKPIDDARKAFKAREEEIVRQREFRDRMRRQLLKSESPNGL